jgi:hypothetical protein
VKAQGSFGQNSARQIGAQLALDKVGDRRALFTSAREKAFEVFSNHLVKQRVLWVVALVCDGMIPERDRAKREVYQRGYTISVHNMSRPACVDFSGWMIPWSLAATSGRIHHPVKNEKTLHFLTRTAPKRTSLLMTNPKSLSRPSGKQSRRSTTTRPVMRAAPNSPSCSQLTVKPSPPGSNAGGTNTPTTWFY